MGNSLTWSRSPSNDSHPKLINRKRKLDDHFGRELSTISKSSSDNSYPELICKRRRGNELENLPEDVLGIILSKLPLKEVVKTSILSTNWRCLWAVCPKLRFDGITMCGNMFGRQQRQDTQKFITNVNALLLQYQGRVVEELVIKFDFDSMLIDHLNNWVRFAVSSCTKFLAFDLIPTNFGNCDDRYKFPFEILDSASLSCLQHIQLSFICLTPPHQFRGFPNLKKLDLRVVRASGKDLQAMLSNCCSLEWLSLARCLVRDELKVDHPLPHLLHLSIEDCDIYKIELDSVKLTTFVYKGLMVPIDLSKASELENVDIHFYRATLEHVITKFPSALPNIQNMTLRASFESQEVPYLIENTHKFSQLKQLHLLSSFDYDIDTMALVSLMRAAPFIEKLEMHVKFSVLPFIYINKDPIRRFSDSLYNNLKNVHITGFEGSKGQLEFLVHILESAPALELLTVHATCSLCENRSPQETATYVALVHIIFRRHVEGKIPPKCSLRLV